MIVATNFHSEFKIDTPFFFFRGKHKTVILTKNSAIFLLNKKKTGSLFFIGNSDDVAADVKSGIGINLGLYTLNFFNLNEIQFYHDYVLINYELFADQDFLLEEKSWDEDDDRPNYTMVPE